MFYSPIIGYTMDSNFRAASLTLYPSDKKKKKQSQMEVFWIIYYLRPLVAC